MATRGDDAGGRPAGRTAKVSPLRNVIGVVVFAAAATVAYVEISANRRASAACQALENALKDEDKGLLTREQAEKKIGRPPDGEGVTEGEQVRYTYTWRGVFRKYALIALYRDGSLINYSCE